MHGKKKGQRGKVKEGRGRIRFVGGPTFSFHEEPSQNWRRKGKSFSIHGGSNRGGEFSVGESREPLWGESRYIQWGGIPPK